MATLKDISEIMGVELKVERISSSVGRPWMASLEYCEIVLGAGGILEAAVAYGYTRRGARMNLASKIRGRYLVTGIPDNRYGVRMPKRVTNS